MTLRQLEMFVAIVEAESFSKAAAKLYVAQPSLSQQIRMLEEELGERLIFRMRNQKMHLTEAGQILKKHSDHVLRQVQILRMEIGALSSEPSGDIRIGIGGHQLTSMLVPAFRTFHTTFPKVRIDIVNGTTLQIVESLKNNGLDVGVVTFPIHADGLYTQVLFSEELEVLIPQSSPLARRKFINPAEIAKLPLVLYDKTTSTRSRIDDFFLQKQVTPHIVLELSSVEAMQQMVEAGMGAAIIPASAAAGARQRRLHSLRITGKPLTREVGVATTCFPRLPKVINELLRLTRDLFPSEQ